MVNANEKERMSLRPSLMTAVGWIEVLDLASNSNLKNSTSHICKRCCVELSGETVLPKSSAPAGDSGPISQPTVLQVLWIQTDPLRKHLCFPSHPCKRAQGGLESLFIVHQISVHIRSAVWAPQYFLFLVKTHLYSLPLNYQHRREPLLHFSWELLLCLWSLTIMIVIDIKSSAQRLQTRGKPWFSRHCKRWCLPWKAQIEGEKKDLKTSSRSLKESAAHPGEKTILSHLCPKFTTSSCFHITCGCKFNVLALHLLWQDQGWPTTSPFLGSPNSGDARCKDLSSSFPASPQHPPSHASPHVLHGWWGPLHVAASLSEQDIKLTIVRPGN